MYSNTYFDAIEKRVRSFTINGQDSYNNIVETIRSASFSGKITEEEAEKLLLMLPDLSDDIEDGLYGSDDKGEMLLDCDLSDDCGEDEEGEWEEESDKKEEDTPFAFGLDDEFLDETPNYKDDDDFYDEENYDNSSSFDLEDDGSELLSYKDNDEDLDIEECNETSDFDLDLNEDCEFYDNSDFEFDEDKAEDADTDPFALFDDEEDY